MGQTTAKTSRAAIQPALWLLLVALASAACHEADPIAQPTPLTPDNELFRLEVVPNSAELSTVVPGNSVALAVKSFNSAGAVMSSAGGVATYSSSAPETAAVSSDGVVTGLVRGPAVITLTLTLGAVTRSATSTVSVLDPGDWPQIAGVYDLNGLITRSDPAWGIEDGTRQVAVVTVQHSGGPQFTGTFSDFAAIGPGGDVTPGSSEPGLVSGVVQRDGRIVMELTNAGMQSSYWYGSGTVNSQGMVGEYGAGGHISGTFTAIRR